METTRTETPRVAPEIVFDEVDTGVATEVRLMEPPEQWNNAPIDAAGDRFDLIRCATTWFGSYEFEFTWEPAPDRVSEQATREILTQLVFGDVTGGGGLFEVELSGPGRFVVRLSGRHPLGQGNREVTGDARFIDSAGSIPCLFAVAGPEPVANEWTPTTQSIDIKPPRVIHPPESLQGIIERMDPTGYGSSVARLWLRWRRTCRNFRSTSST